MAKPKAKRAAKSKIVKVPDYCYDMLDWEVTYPWADRLNIMDDADDFTPVEIGVLKALPSQWAVKGEDGTVKFFDTELEAKDYSDKIFTAHLNAQDDGSD